MTDGVYSVAVTLTGGTGRASIASPLQLSVSGGEMTARIEWSSPNYDLMIVDGKELLPVNTEGNSVFEIPVYTLDAPLSVRAETVAMSEPHLISYEIAFDKSTLTGGENTVLSLVFCLSAVLVSIVLTAAASVFAKKKK